MTRIILLCVVINIECERSGLRDVIQNSFSANNTALSNLDLAELIEGKGHFID